MPAGRPSTYDPAYCEAIVEHMADGASISSFAASIDAGRTTIVQWAEAHPEFKLAVMRGKAKAAAWWEKAGRGVATGADGNATMCIFGMKNMGGEDWIDATRQELTGKDGEALPIINVGFCGNTPRD